MRRHRALFLGVVEKAVGQGRDPMEEVGGRVYLGPRSWLPRTPAKDWLLLTRALSRRRCGRTDRDIME